MDLRVKERLRSKKFMNEMTSVPVPVKFSNDFPHQQQQQAKSVFFCEWQKRAKRALRHDTSYTKLGCGKSILLAVVAAQKRLCSAALLKVKAFPFWQTKA